MEAEAATPVVDTPVTPPTVETPSAPIEEPASIAELSEATFGNPAADEETAEQADRNRRWSGRFAGGTDSQRAKSHRAGRKDTDQIDALTKRLREAESELGLKIEKQDGESDRVFALRQRAEIAEALREARKAPKVDAPKPQTVPQARVEAPAAPSNLKPFDEKEPQPEDFAEESNPLSAYTKALAGYEFRRQIHDAQQALVAQRTTESQHIAIKAAHEHAAKVQAKIDAFKVEHPDYDQRIEAMEDLLLPDVLLETISTDDNPPKIAYALACNPDELVDLIGFAAALDYSPQSVALLRRRIARTARNAQAIGATPSESKGAPPPVPVPVIVAPRPPTPLGAGSMKRREEPPAEPTSIAEFARFYGPNAKR